MGATYLDPAPLLLGYSFTGCYYFALEATVPFGLARPGVRAKGDFYCCRFLLAVALSLEVPRVPSFWITKPDRSKSLFM